MRTVKEVSRLAHISVRTLHYYDAIGLLPPTQITESGYRLYDETALARLQQILLLRELDFPLREIADMLKVEEKDWRLIMAQQVHLLQLKRARLDRMIDLACKLQTTGVTHLDFSAFDAKEMEDCAAQAKLLWGKTKAYQEYTRKAAGRSGDAEASLGQQLMDIFRQLGTMRQERPESEAVQAQIRRLQQFITEHYYTCTPQILKGLGKMYTAGDSMTANIDDAGGAGTAAFTQRAIEIYCKE